MNLSGNTAIYPKRLVVGGGPVPPAPEPEIYMNESFGLSPTVVPVLIGPINSLGILSRYLSAGEIGVAAGSDVDRAVLIGSHTLGINGYQGNDFALMFDFSAFGNLTISETRILTSQLTSQITLIDALTLNPVVSAQWTYNQKTGNQTGSVIAPLSVPVTSGAGSATGILLRFNLDDTLDVYDNVTGTLSGTIPCIVPQGGLALVSTSAVQLSIVSANNYTYNVADTVGSATTIIHKADAIAAAAFGSLADGYTSIQGFPIP